LKKKTFTEEEMRAFAPAEKIGLVASIDPQGQPHITLITSIMAPQANQLTLGQFCEGLSKQYIQKNPNIAFLIMTMDKKMWRGRAQWRYLRKEGPEFERYNDIPMFRYNTYFGINTVHYLDLIETSPGCVLPLARIIGAALITQIAKPGARDKNRPPILNPFGVTLFNSRAALKFLAYVGRDGFPVLIPVIQCQAADSGRLAFSALAYHNELRRIPPHTRVAVFGMTLQMEDVLVRGTFQGYRRCRLFNLGIIDIDWVYNSMPPCHGQIYPQVPLEPVVEF